MATRIVEVQEDDFCRYCDEVIPAPHIARPVIVAREGKAALSLVLRYRGHAIRVMHGAKPRFYRTVGQIIDALDGVPNVDITRLSVDTATYLA